MGKEIERIVNAERVEDLIAVFGSFKISMPHITPQGLRSCALSHLFCDNFLIESMK